MFRQGVVHAEYLLHLYTLFQNLKIQNPKPAGVSRPTWPSPNGQGQEGRRRQTG